MSMEYVSHRPREVTQHRFYSRAARFESGRLVGVVPRWLISTSVTLIYCIVYDVSGLWCRIAALPSPRVQMRLLAYILLFVPSTAAFLVPSTVRSPTGVQHASSRMRTALAAIDVPPGDQALGGGMTLTKKSASPGGGLQSATYFEITVPTKDGISIHDISPAIRKVRRDALTPSVEMLNPHAFEKLWWLVARPFDFAPESRH